jgi:meso-butanediol dehydrogenase/(S,S)-butanediol dehydrogenase/diacetyl reductase
LTSQQQSRVVVVTGAAAGIGRGIAERFAEEGGAVAALDRDATGLERLATAHPNLFVLPSDVSDEASSAAAFETIRERWGRVDVLVNNAGIELHGAVAEMPVEQWDRVLAVNLRGAYLMSRGAIPLMRDQGGSIINIASVHAFVAYPGCAAYDTTKAGLLGFTRALALDHGRDGIRVNAICPGYIHTPLMDQWLAQLPDREAEMRRIIELHPVGRIGTPRDVAELALFLAAPQAGFITGAAITLDGGMTLTR